MTTKINEKDEKAQHQLDRRIEHLLLSTQLEETGTTKFILGSIFVICFTIIYLLYWAAVISRRV